MLPHQFQELLDKYTRGACTPQEQRLIHDWYENVHDVQEHLPDSSDGTTSGEEIRNRIWAGINPMPEAAPSRSSWGMKAAVIAIPILIGMAIFFSRNAKPPLATSLLKEMSVLKEEKNHITNNTRGPLTVPLSDGSEVILRPSSEIVMSGDFGIADRKVLLNGEAFFKVSPDVEKPFFVYANEVVTRVLGTSFNVRAYEQDIQVTVAVMTGKVSVYTHKDRTSRNRRRIPPHEVVLTPNQQVVYDRAKEKVTRQLVEKPDIILPDSQLFKMQFDNVEVSTILDVLKANYGIEIRYDRQELSGCKLTTSMSDEGLYERIEVICRAIGASYKIDDTAITIVSDGC